MLNFILTLALIGGVVGLLASRTGDSSRDFFNGAKDGAFIGCGCGCFGFILAIVFLFLMTLLATSGVF